MPGPVGTTYESRRVCVRDQFAATNPTLRDDLSQLTNPAESRPGG
jgi:hypothetical protein